MMMKVAIIGSRSYTNTKKIKDFVVKYWKILIAFCLVLLGYLIAKRSDNTKIINAI